MNRLAIENRCRIVASLLEGTSIRATVRATGAAKNTVQKLLLELGSASSEYMDRTFRGLNCKRIRVEECWAFCYAKAKNVTAEVKPKNSNAGDAWIWAAVDAESKLVPSWIIGARDGVTARMFVNDLASRLATRVQLTSDGLNIYLAAVEHAFRCDVDYAQLIKIYNETSDSQKHYSPAECLDCRKMAVVGHPDPDHISTSYTERADLTMRIGMRRFSSLTNGFSKKLDNFAAAVALHMMHYNFVRIHPTSRVTPAMAAGVANTLWCISDVVALLNQENSNNPPPEAN